MVVKRKRAKGTRHKASKAKEPCQVDKQTKASCSKDASSVQTENMDLPSSQSSGKLPQSSSEISQLELIAIACGSDLKLSCDDDRWTCEHKRRNIMRSGPKDVVSARKNNIYHKNNFHFSLKDKWSKLVTDKISALAFSRSLRGCKN